MKVSAGAEGPAVPREQDRPSVALVAQAGEQPREFGVDGVVDGVDRRVVERDVEHRSVALESNGLEVGVVESGKDVDQWTCHTVSRARFVTARSRPPFMG